MKIITRRQLRRLIAEAYRAGVPYRSPIDQSDAMISRNFPQFTDKIAAVDPNQSEAFKSALDPSRPTPDVKLRSIDDCMNGLCQHQIDDAVDEYFSYMPKQFAGAMSQGGMTLRQIAEEIFHYCVTGPGIGLETLYPGDANGVPIPRYDDIEEVIGRYEKSLSRPQIRTMGHIS
tara:strand:- start:313 stop:834 length:522 start_codon:yes stop_codon:yes gene_type:complete